MACYHQHRAGMSSGTEGNWGWMLGGGGNRKKKRQKKEVCFLFSSLRVSAAVLEQDLWFWDTKTNRLKGKSSHCLAPNQNLHHCSTFVASK